MKSLLLAISILLSATIVLGSNILAFMPTPAISHIRAFRPLFIELAQRGHNVTFYTGVPFDEEIPNLKQIVIKYDFQSFIEANLKTGLSSWEHIFLLKRLGLYACERLFKNPDIEALIKSTDSEYDVILIETFFAHEPFIALGHKFNAPIIHLHPFRDEVWISNILRNPNPLSYVPNFRLATRGHLSFYQRAVNVMLSVMELGIGHLHYLPEQEKLMRKYFKYQGSETLPPLLSQLRNTSLVFLDANGILNSASPLLPNFINVGGIHISNTSKHLSPDLEKWINDSPNGVIYLSLGSLIKVSDMEPEKLNVFLNVLGKLPQRVLWKWEKNGNIPGQPANVKTSKWFPQTSILAHPKCRAFITHGGFHSILEAAYFGVPVIGTPVFSDQESNILCAENNGFGQMVKFSEFSEEILSFALNKVLNDPSFQDNAKRLSRLIRDVQNTPLETALYWVEHVLRHKGVPHLTPVAVSLPWYEYNLVDVIGTAVIVAIFLTTLLYKILKIIVRILVKKPSVNKRKKE